MANALGYFPGRTSHVSASHDCTGKSNTTLRGLDGTLLKTDLLWESLVRLLKRNPLYVVPRAVLVDAWPRLSQTANRRAR